MFAVITSGGKQYRVQEGDTLKVELLPEEIGSTIKFDQVLMVGAEKSVKVGKPFVKGSHVTASVLSQGRHKKVHILKFRRRKHHMKQQGHRQYFSELKIESIVA